MIKRRGFTKLVVASTLLPFPVSSLAKLSVNNNFKRSPVHFVYETRAGEYGLKENLVFEEFDKMHYISGDATRVWYEELHFLWKTKSIVTAGLTRESEFFILKTLARDYGYRPEHENYSENSRLVSWLLVPVDKTSPNV
jgi:hypothetical protein